MRELHTETPPLIVALTGWGQPADRQRSLEAGFDAHFVKPLTPQDLRKLLRQAQGRIRAWG